MKIAYIKNENLPYDNHEIIQTFKENGVAVVSTTQQNSEDNIIECLNQERPAFAFCVFQKGKWDGFFSAVKQACVPVVAWTTDDPYSLDYTKRRIHHFDYLFSPDKYAATVYRKLGHQRTYVLPYGTLPNLFYHDPSKKRIYESDVCLIGDADDKRASYVEYLYRQTDWTIRVVGRGWKEAIMNFKPSTRLLAVNYWVPPSIARLFYSNSKIVLNIPPVYKTLDNATGFPAHGPSSDFYQIAGCKAFQIAEKRKGISELFHSPKTIVQMNSKEECLAFASHYLRNEEDRTLMAEAAFNEVTSRHLLSHRLQSLIETIQEQFVTNPERI